MSFQKGNTFVFGETPAASKWDQLWRNDDALADGSGLDDGSVTTAKLADGSVTTAKIANADVTPDKLATGATTATVATIQSTTSTSYTDLSTPGPAVTVDIGANGLALVEVSATLWGNAATYDVYMGCAVSGASTVAAADSQALSNRNTNGISASRVILYTGLTPGSTTFTAKYRVGSAGTGNFLNRRISVVPL